MFCCGLFDSFLWKTKAIGFYACLSFVVVVVVDFFSMVFLRKAEPLRNVLGIFVIFSCFWVDMGNPACQASQTYGLSQGRRKFWVFLVSFFWNSLHYSICLFVVFTDRNIGDGLTSFGRPLCSVENQFSVRTVRAFA